jgi:hypothetical protein
VDPHLIFSSALPSSSAIRPLQSQLTRTESSIWQLHAFEALLALTNLASLDAATQHLIIRSAFDVIADDLLLSANTLLRCAATQLICNLMGSPYCVEKFADGSPRAKHRLHLLLAMTDVDDTPTRSAAGGALATLLSCGDITVTPFLAQEKGVEFLIGLCRDEDEELQLRGVVCLQSVGEVAEGKKAVRGKGGVDVVAKVIEKSKSQMVKGAAREALAVLRQ